MVDRVMDCLAIEPKAIQSINNDRFSFAWRTFLITNSSQMEAVGDHWKEQRQRFGGKKWRTHWNWKTLETFGARRQQQFTYIGHARQSNRHWQNEITDDAVNNNENEKQSKCIGIIISFTSNYQLKDSSMFIFNDAPSRTETRTQAYAHAFR